MQLNRSINLAENCQGSARAWLGFILEHSAFPIHGALQEKVHQNGDQHFQIYPFLKVK